MQKNKHLLAKCVTFTFTMLLFVGYISVPVNGYPSNTFRDLDICNHWNGRRHFLELGERGDLHARNVTTSAFRVCNYFVSSVVLSMNILKYFFSIS